MTGNDWEILHDLISLVDICEISIQFCGNNKVKLVIKTNTDNYDEIRAFTDMLKNVEVTIVRKHKNTKL